MCSATWTLTLLSLWKDGLNLNDLHMNSLEDCKSTTPLPERMSARVEKKSNQLLARGYEFVRSSVSCSEPIGYFRDV